MHSVDSATERELNSSQAFNVLAFPLEYQVRAISRIGSECLPQSDRTLSRQAYDAINQTISKVRIELDWLRSSGVGKRKDNLVSIDDLQVKLNRLQDLADLLYKIAVPV